MTFLLGMAQVGYPADGDVRAQACAVAAAAQQAGVQLLVFPENFMSPRALQAEELARLAEPVEGPFVAHMASLAREYGLWMVFTMSEVNPAGGPPFNTAVVVDDAGHVQARYRKCHLYDAHQVRESDRMTAGEALCLPVTAPFATLGLGICYDLRFPEVTRTAAIAGAQVMLFPACWHDGPQKQAHWETLLTARAIENECFVAGICHAGKHLVARSMAVGPLGQELPATSIAVGTAGDQLLVVEVDTNEVAAARDAMPILAHRRPELYQALTT